MYAFQVHPFTADPPNLQVNIYIVYIIEIGLDR